MISSSLIALPPIVLLVVLVPLGGFSYAQRFRPLSKGWLNNTRHVNMVHDELESHSFIFVVGAAHSGLVMLQ
jgi:hypothetical protein